MASSSSWDMSGEPPSLSSLLELANNVGAWGEFREIMRAARSQRSATITGLWRLKPPSFFACRSVRKLVACW